MDKNIAIVLVVAVVLVGFLALENITPKKTTPQVTPTTRAQVTQTTVASSPSTETNQLSELQVTACNAADRANTCETRLPKLVGLVTKEDCCRYLNKCC